jgi:hypothetical protein
MLFLILEAKCGIIGGAGGYYDRYEAWTELSIRGLYAEIFLASRLLLTLLPWNVWVGFRNAGFFATQGGTLS